LLEGNLVKDPVLYQTNSGTSVCHFSVAVNRSYKKKTIEKGTKEYEQEVSFIDIEAWAGQAESCKQYLTKGRGVRVVGRLKQDRWFDEKQESKTRVKIIADNVEFKPIYKGI